MKLSLSTVLVITQSLWAIINALSYEGPVHWGTDTPDTIDIAGPKACERIVNTNCGCNCDCGTVDRGDDKTCNGGSCPGQKNKKCITCTGQVNNWACDIYGDATECDESSGELYCLGYTDGSGFNRRCARKLECGGNFIQGPMVAGKNADGIGCKLATCEVYGCKAFENPEPNQELSHCSLNMQNSRQWVPVGKNLGLCGCDNWCWEFYDSEMRCDCCSDYFSFCAPYDSGYQALMTEVNKPSNIGDAPNQLEVQSWRCEPTTAETFGRFRDENKQFINCQKINSADSACD